MSKSNAVYETETRITFEGWKQEKEQGSCNGCNRYSTLDGVAPHRVACFHIGGMQVRLCVHCVSALSALLKQV